MTAPRSPEEHGMTPAQPAPLPIALTDSLPRPTRLRQFDKVQERRFVHIELGRAVQLVLFGLVVLSGAFLGGWIAGVQGWRPAWLSGALAVAAPAVVAAPVAVAPPPAPAPPAVAAPAVASAEAMLAALDDAALVAKEAAAPPAPLLIAAADERVVGSDEPAEPVAEGGAMQAAAADASSADPAAAAASGSASVAAPAGSHDPDGARAGPEATALPPAKPVVQPVHPDGEAAPATGSDGKPNAVAVAAVPPPVGPETTQPAVVKALPAATRKHAGEAAKPAVTVLAKAAPLPTATKPAAPAQPAAPSGPAPTGETADEPNAPTDKAEDKSPKAGRPPAGKYVVQIKAFRNQSEAEAFAAELRGKGYTVSVSAVEVPDKGQFFRVRMGPFGTLETARGAQKKLETAEGHQTIVLATP